MLRRFLDDTRGATAIEYGLILSLMFLAIVGALYGYADKMSAMFNRISNTLAVAISGG